MTSIILSALLATHMEATDIHLLRTPAVHGQTVVFTYAGDLWKSTLSGGIAQRLTVHPGGETNPQISPDGEFIAFTGMYDGYPNVYVMPMEGGEPRRVTFSSDGDFPTGWTKDGKIMYRTSRGSAIRATRLWMVDPKGGYPTPSPVVEFTNGTLDSSGTKLAYNRNNSYGFNWRRYRGGTQGRIGFFDLKNLTYDEMPQGKENSWWPMWVGNKVYFVSDAQDQTVNLYSYDLGSQKKARLTQFNDADIKNASTDGKTIVFERNTVLYAYDIASGRTTSVSPKIVGDLLTTRPALRSFAPYISELNLSPSGARLVVEARGEIFSVPAKSGETRNLSETTGAREKGAEWAPDGQSIAYLSDQDGEFQIYTKPQRGGTATQLTSDPKVVILSAQWTPDSKTLIFRTVDHRLGKVDVATKKVTILHKGTQQIGPVDISPDSNWVALTEARENLQYGISLIDLRTDKLTPVSSGFYEDSAASFDLNGKYLYFVSRRSFNPVQGAFGFTFSFDRSQRVYAMALQSGASNPLAAKSDEEPLKAPDTKPVDKKPDAPKSDGFRIDLDGLSDRIFALPWPSGDYGFVLGAENGVFTFADGALLKFDFDSRQSVEILSGFGQLAFNANRTKIAYRGPTGIGIIPATPGGQIGQGRVDTSQVTATIDPKKEWSQMYWEAWRYQRDNFYDPKMLGLDWNAIGKKYASMLPYVAHRSELNTIIGLMIGELGTGHAYNGGGDMGAPPAFPIADLGCDFELVGSKLKFKKIYRGNTFDPANEGPLAVPGVNIKEGEYLLEVNGNAVGAEADPYKFLANKVGAQVVLTVNSSASLTGARKVTVKPIADDSAVRYADWVEDNRQLVRKLSGGKIGYAHVPDTSQPGWIGLARGFYSDAGKEAFLVDERYNGGGNIPDVMVWQLQQKIHSRIQQRNGEQVGLPSQIQDVPKLMLINEFAGSGGDMFPWLFKKYSLGPLMGNRTWGGLVGIAGAFPLMDGGFVSSPTFGIFDHEKGEWIAENQGIAPDIQVDLRPDLVAKGRDLQIEKAVEYLLAEIKKNKKVSKTPPFKNVPKG